MAQQSLAALWGARAAPPASAAQLDISSTASAGSAGCSAGGGGGGSSFGKCPVCQRSIMLRTADEHVMMCLGGGGGGGTAIGGASSDAANAAVGTSSSARGRRRPREEEPAKIVAGPRTKHRVSGVQLLGEYRPPQVPAWGALVDKQLRRLLLEDSEASIRTATGLYRDGLEAHGAAFGQGYENIFADRRLPCVPHFHPSCPPCGLTGLGVCARAVVVLQMQCEIPRGFVVAPPAPARALGPPPTAGQMYSAAICCSLQETRLPRVCAWVRRG
jgi:hypothetical protein